MYLLSERGCRYENLFGIGVPIIPWLLQSSAWNLGSGCGYGEDGARLGRKQELVLVIPARSYGGTLANPHTSTINYDFTLMNCN